jgi:predicted phage terminase large subunit-like protein
MEMVDRLIEFHDRLRPRLIGVEQNGGYALIRPLLQMRLGGRFIPVRYVTHREAKELRIERLCPQFEAGLWLFPRRPGAGVATLQEQLLHYPDGFVDGPDALAGCAELLPDAFTPVPGPAYRSLHRRGDFAAL